MGSGSVTADLRYAFRSLTRRPGFTALVLATLALGIGATTVIFSVVDTVLLRPLPYEDADGLVAVGNTFPGREWSDQAQGLQHLAGVSYLNFSEVRARTRTLSDLAAGEWAAVLLPDEGEGPQMATMVRVTEGFFDLLGVAPALGRTFLPEDHEAGAEQLVILSYGAWATRFGADPTIVGEAFPSAGSSYTVLGVLPADFRPPEAILPKSTEFWMPLDPSHPRYQERGRRSLALVGRLANGTTVDQARAELTALADGLAQEFPDGNVYPDGSRLGYGANSLQAETVGGTRRTLLIFLSASALLLLIAVLNAAHLLLVRGLDRVGELSLRRAVGASRWAATRHLLVESLLLAGGGGALGLFLAFGGVRAFLAFVPPNMPRLGEVRVDLRILAVCALVSLGVGVLTGLVPALRFGGRDIADTLKKGSYRGAPASGTRVRMSLVSAQLALALVLAVGASLLLESFLRVRSVDPGFEPEGLLAFSMPMKRLGSLDQASWMAWDDLVREVAAIPGVRVAAGSNLPFQSPNWGPGVLLPGEPLETRRDGIAGYAITPPYFDVLGIPLLVGRRFASADGPEGEAVAIVNERFVQEVLGGGVAIGQEIFFRTDEEGRESRRIVGVVGDVIQTRAEEVKGPGRRGTRCTDQKCRLAFSHLYPVDHRTAETL